MLFNEEIKDNPRFGSYYRSGIPFICTSIGAITAYWIVSHYLQQDEEKASYFKPFMNQLENLMMPIVGECAGDKNLELALNKIDNRMKDLEMKYPGMKRAMLQHGF